MTPEGKVKRRIKATLDRFWNVYYDMPVPSGFGKQGLDFNCGVGGWALYIEAKAPTGQLSPRQRETCWRMAEAGNAVFIISGDEGLSALFQWLRRRVPMKEQVPNPPPIRRTLVDIWAP